MPIRAPYGSWSSPISSELLVRSSSRLGDVVLSDGVVTFTESRPEERGRAVLVRAAGGAAVDVTPAPFDVRTRVHEYGGGAFTVDRGVAYFSNFADGRIYRVAPGVAPEPLTGAGSLRYAALQVDGRRHRLLAVLEEHEEGAKEPKNSLVSLSLDGSGERRTLAMGSDFYASPRLGPDGATLCWLEWQHPNMPWDGTELWVGTLDAGGALVSRRRVAGGASESIFQPEWGKDGTLYFVSDRSGYWNLYADRGGSAEPLLPMEAEFGLPQWVFEMSTYAPLADGRLLVSFSKDGRSRLGLLDPRVKSFEEIDVPYREVTSVRAEGSLAVFGAASPTVSPCLVELDLRSRAHRVVRRFSGVDVDPGYLSEPRALAYPTANGSVAHALYYPPRNQDYEGEAGAPPLLVKSHGGPTAAASAALNLRTQYYTSRGIGVLDVDYRGSTGYGRAYREALRGAWGVADVDDCAYGALFLVRKGEADPSRLMITGGSAGGFTTLAALTFRDVFKAGASHYGISDLEALARDTHKFESRYLDSLVGPYPERRDLYVARSPIHHAERLSCPVIFFQGLEDRVVPPNQAEAMVAVLRKKGIPVSYVPFEGEHHGFRRAENIRRAIEAELTFFSRVLKFEIRDPVPLAIDNL